MMYTWIFLQQPSPCLQHDVMKFAIYFLSVCTWTSKVLNTRSHLPRCQITYTTPWYVSIVTDTQNRILYLLHRQAWKRNSLDCPLRFIFTPNTRVNIIYITRTRGHEHARYIHTYMMHYKYINVLYLYIYGISE